LKKRQGTSNAPEGPEEEENKICPREQWTGAQQSSGPKDSSERGVYSYKKKGERSRENAGLLLFFLFSSCALSPR